MLADESWGYGMNKINVGQTISILANIGVIAGIVFLAVELRQNNALLAADARSNLADRRTRFIEMIAQSPDLSELMVKAARNQELTPAEQIRFGQLGTRLLASWESQFLEVKEGAVSVDTLPIRQWRVMFHRTSPSALDYRLKAALDSYRDEGRLDFVEFMEERIIKPGPP